MKVSEFQDLMQKLYFHQDSKRGIKATYIWLVEEIGELASLIKEQKIDKDKAADEIADIIAWTCSVANLLDINIEEALLNKYPNKCRKCDSIPCKCMKSKYGSVNV